MTPAPASFRVFSAAALSAPDVHGLRCAFAEACAALGVTRHRATWRTSAHSTVISCDYPFDPDAMDELGAREFSWPMADGTSVDVRVAVTPLSDPDRARLAGATMLFATRLWQLTCQHVVVPAQQQPAFRARTATCVR